MPPLLLALAMIAQDTTTVSQMGLTIAEGPAKLRVLRENPLVGSMPPRANIVRDKATQSVANSLHFLGLHRGDLTSSCFVSESQLEGFLHAPLFGLASSRPGFPDRDYPGKSLETTWPGFALRDISHYLVLWRGTCPCWLSPVHCDLGPTQILT
jgi:hypothetical protein